MWEKPEPFVPLAARWNWVVAKQRGGQWAVREAEAAEAAEAEAAEAAEAEAAEAAAGDSGRRCSPCAAARGGGSRAPRR